MNVAADKVDPIHQFHLNEIFPLEIGGYDLAFTNSSLFMVVTVVVAGAFFYFSTSGRALVPSRWQSSAEILYEFTASMLKDAAGSHGMKFFPFVFTVFMFVLTANLLGLSPLVVGIEVISFLSRPISLSVRLFANMLAGHITLKVFAGFVVSLSAMGAVGVAGAVLPLAMAVAITALELLVAALQAYVFAILTCMYLADAVHPGH